MDNWKWGDTGKLPDQWAWNEVHPIWLEEIRDDNSALFEVIEAAEHCHGKDIAAFLCFLSVRLLEMHRILKPTGSLYLHCDHTANAYIRMALDAIFGAKNFRNEIVWKRYPVHSLSNNSFDKIADSIFFYTKSNPSTFNRTYGETSQEDLANKFPLLENETVRRFQHVALEQSSNSSSAGEPRKIGERTVTSEIGWRWTQQTFDERIKENPNLIYWTAGGRPRFKLYADEYEGTPLGNIWTDINPPSKTERTGSPDQKPLALYERIILASSNPGDLVLDPFAGCATTIMAAKNNGRRWVGIDRRPDARFHVVCRMEGIRAKDAEEIRKLPHLTDWLDARLARHDAHFRTEPPTRTDEGDTAAPFLAAVHTASEKSLLSHREMKDHLINTFGLQCWGCSFTAPDERHLQLDHVDPKADGGSNHLDNRALLCGPCNMAKGNRLTMSALRRQNTRDGHLMKPTGTPRGQDGHPIRLPEARARCRDALERHRRGQPLQLGLML